MIQKYVIMLFFKKNSKRSNIKPEILHEDKTDKSEEKKRNLFFASVGPGKRITPLQKDPKRQQKSCKT